MIVGVGGGRQGGGRPASYAVTALVTEGIFDR
jgi:hypothetical protein